MKRASRALFAIVAALAIVVVALAFLHRRGVEVPGLGRLPFVEASAASETLEIFGNVERREVSLAFNVAGRIAEVLVEEGDEVTVGTELARLEQDRFEDQVAVAEARVRQQRALLDELESGTRPEEIEQARARVASAEATLTAVERELARIRALASDDFASERALDDARAEREQAATQLRVAEADLALALEGPREERIRAAEAQLTALEAELSLARENLEDSILRAPVIGVIRDRIVEPGAIVGPERPVYLLARAAPFYVRAYVAEPHLGRIAPGMRVEVVTDTRPEAPYEGWIGFISPTAEFTPKTVHTPEVRTSLVYRLRVIVAGEPEGLRLGMPVTVRVPLDDDERSAPR